MGAYHEFFMCGDLTPDEVAAELSRAAELSFSPADGRNDLMYRANDNSTAIEIRFGHEFENNLGIDFEGFPIQVTVRDLDRNKARQLATAQRIFDGIDRSKLRAQLVFDGQVLIAKNWTDSTA